MSDDLKKVKDSLAQVEYAVDTIVYILAVARLSLNRLETDLALQAQADSEAQAAS